MNWPRSYIVSVVVTCNALTSISATAFTLCYPMEYLPVQTLRPIRQSPRCLRPNHTQPTVLDRTESSGQTMG